MKTKATVIIPAKNEGVTIAEVVRAAKQAKWIDEVIVVDGHSIDDTVEEAKSAGAKVITQSKELYPGKGVAMRDGFMAASNDIIAFVDADIVNIGPTMLEQLVEPIVRNEADFVKGAFERAAGRVTELVAKPLLEMFFPEVAGFSQPLSGEIAGRRWVFERAKFEENWGVDVGILIDAVRAGARVKEVHIGFKDHIMKPLLDLRDMAYQVAKTIIERAGKQDILKDLDWISPPHYSVIYHGEVKVRPKAKLVVFDFDETLVDGRVIDVLAKKFGFTKKLEAVRGTVPSGHEQSSEIAKLLKGLKIQDVLNAVREMPTMPGAGKVLQELKSRGCYTGIISDSYRRAIEAKVSELPIDFIVANELDVQEGILTGDVHMPFGWVKKDDCLEHSVCKLAALKRLAEEAGADMSEVVAIGNGDVDTCMVEAAGFGIAFNPNSVKLIEVADVVIKEKDMRRILEHLHQLL
jgi:phosphoserine phosphatase SerB